MTEGRKQALSLRVTTGDLRKIKKLARRLGARDSDVIRFALKTMFARLAPLCDDSVQGRALLPVFIEAGSELFHHFDLDAVRLEEIVNAGVSKAQEVATDDLELIAMAGIHQTRSELRLNKLNQALVNERLGNMEEALGGRLRGYIHSKYAAEEPTSDSAAE
jgi:hypothetical protein